LARGQAGSGSATSLGITTMAKSSHKGKQEKGPPKGTETRN